MPTCWLLNCKRWYCNMSDWKQLQYYFQSSSFRQRGIFFPWNKFRHVIVWVCRIPVHSHPVLHTHYLNSCSYSWWIELKMWLTMMTLKRQYTPSTYTSNLIFFCFKVVFFLLVFTSTVYFQNHIIANLVKTHARNVEQIKEME